jgi:hypothetical protein
VNGWIATVLSPENLDETAEWPGGVDGDHGSARDRQSVVITKDHRVLTAARVLSA